MLVSDTEGYLPSASATQGNPQYQIPASSLAPFSSPQKSSHKGRGHNSSMPQPPKPPEKPLQPYMRYSRDNYDKVKTEFPDMKLSEISKIMGQRWKQLTEKEKQKYVDDWEYEKQAYSEQIKIYHNSPEYKTWLKNKNELEAANKRLAMAEQHSMYSQPPSVISTSQMSISQASHEDDEGEYITMQQVASARYQRNHRLMAEIFNEVVVPDFKPAKINTMQEKIETITQGNKKLGEECEAIDEKCRKRRKKLIVDNKNFVKEMKRIRENPLTLPKKGPPPVKIQPLAASEAKLVKL